MESDAEYTGTYAGDTYGPGVHRKGQQGRHAGSGSRHVEGQTAQPLGQPGEKAPPVRDMDPGRD